MISDLSLGYSSNLDRIFVFSFFLQKALSFLHDRAIPRRVPESSMLALVFYTVPYWGTEEGCGNGSPLKNDYWRGCFFPSRLMDSKRHWGIHLYKHHVDSSGILFVQQIRWENFLQCVKDIVLLRVQLGISIHRTRLVRRILVIFLGRKSLRIPHFESTRAGLDLLKCARIVSVHDAYPSRFLAEGANTIVSSHIDCFDNEPVCSPTTRHSSYEAHPT